MKYPDIYHCKHSYGSDGIMTDCTKVLDSPRCRGRKCIGFEKRATPKNEDERAIQFMEWD